MDCDQFVAVKRAQLRAFDNWAWKDALASPAEYENYTQQDWENLFQTFLENAE